MSIFRPVVVTCPSCGDVQARRLAHSVNAERSPALREAILAGALHRFSCEACGQGFEANQPFSYLDMPRKHWFGVYGAEDEGGWVGLEPHPREAYVTACGPQAPGFLQEMTQDMKIRLVFGISALQEKLVCHDASIDDVLLEVFKYAMFMRELPYRPGDHLRLSQVQGDQLGFTYSRQGQLPERVHAVPFLQRDQELLQAQRSGHGQFSI